jgi:hypothetical protein
MKTIERKNITKLPQIIFIKDESLARFEGKTLFPEKIARAKEKFKNIVLPVL